MKLSVKKLLCTSAICGLTFAPVSGNLFDDINVSFEINRASAKTLASTTVYIVGDSTSCIYKDDSAKYSIHRAGWGMYLQNYLDNKAKVVDLAISGRSSKSFTTEKEYAEFKSEIKAGDYVIIQFGHNDAKRTSEKDKATRYTDPLGDINKVGSFKNSLYANYIKIARDKGAIPILISPVSRLKFDENGKTEDTHEDYDDAVRALAKETNTPLIDMTNITAEYYNQLGSQDTKLMHAVFNDVKKGLDTTHFSHYGANVIASKVAQEISNLNIGLKDYVVGSAFTADENTYIKKGDFAFLLTTTLGLKADNETDSFSDVPNDYHAKFMAIAKANGLIKGNKDGTMGYNNYITRQEAAVITCKALKQINQLRKVNEKNALSYVIKQGYMKKSNGKDAPNERLTKEDAERIAISLYDVHTSGVLSQLNGKPKISRDELEKVE